MTNFGRWTHPSVLALQEESGGADPVAEIARRAEEMALNAMEAGWSGPPFDPFALADHLGVEVIGREDLDDARLVDAEGTPRIEFNPLRRPARVRFSLAHEIGHLLFTDHGERTRYRARAHAEQAPGDEWQLEMLCNVAAAELLMPAGAFPAGHLEDLSLPHLLDLRKRFGVSTEALVRRVVKLTDLPVCLVAAARHRDRPGLRLDYGVRSRAWNGPVPDESDIPASTALARCTAVGFSVEADESWGEHEVRVQAAGIPPYPGDRLPRVVALLAQPAAGHSAHALRYVRGDATEPHREGPTIIAHIVNDRAQRWSPRGFAGALMRRHPPAATLYETWQGEDARRLGSVHLGQLDENLWVASLVAQAGYGEARPGRPRLRVTALRAALDGLATLAAERDASVHMPLMGTGQAGGSWPVVRDLVLAELVDQGVPVQVYVLPEQSMPDEQAAQLILA